MADIWSGNADDDKAWAKEEQKVQRQLDLEYEIAWMEFRTHTDRIANFFKGCAIGREAAHKVKAVDAQRLAGWYQMKRGGIR